MKTYISILMGINVSGKNTVKMDELRKLFEGLNFQKVTTYVQSGNIVFSASQIETGEIEKLIHSQIIKELGLDLPVIVFTKETLKQIIDKNPFAKDKEKAFLHFTFLAKSIVDFNKDVVESKKANDEEICIVENVVYLYCPNGYGKTKLSNTFLESKLKVTATTRNWKTATELLKIAEQII
jgi:Uncharacterized protein conserved in bacteria